MSVLLKWTLLSPSTGEPALGLTNCSVTFYLSGLLLLIRYKVCEDGEADRVRYQLSEPTHGEERVFTVSIQNLSRPAKRGFCYSSENRPSAVQDQVWSSQGRTATWRDLQL